MVSTSLVHQIPSIESLPSMHVLGSLFPSNDWSAFELYIIVREELVQLAVEDVFNCIHDYY